MKKNMLAAKKTGAWNTAVLIWKDCLPGWYESLGIGAPCVPQFASMQARGCFWRKTPHREKGVGGRPPRGFLAPGRRQNKGGKE